jgi:hypothetical protein
MKLMRSSGFKTWAALSQDYTKAQHPGIYHWRLHRKKC